MSGSGRSVPAGFFVATSSLEAVDRESWSAATAAQVERSVQTSDLLVVAHVILDVLFHLDCPPGGDAFVVYTTDREGTILQDAENYMVLSDAVAAIEVKMAMAWSMNLPLRQSFKHWR